MTGNFEGMYLGNGFTCMQFSGERGEQAERMTGGRSDMTSA